MCTNHRNVLGHKLTRTAHSPQFVLTNFRNHHYHLTSSQNPKAIMNISLAIAPIVSLIAGILILVVPRMLNYIVAIYLIVIGILGLFPHLR